MVVMLAVAEHLYDSSRWLEESGTQSIIFIINSIGQEVEHLHISLELIKGERSLFIIALC